MVNFLWIVLGTLFFSILLGIAIVFSVWFLISKYLAFKEKKQIPMNEIEKQRQKHLEAKNERRENENDGRNKFRQFEKLRAGKLENESFYSRKFKDERQGFIQDRFSEPVNRNERNTEEPEREPEKLEWY